MRDLGDKSWCVRSHHQNSITLVQLIVYAHPFACPRQPVLVEMFAVNVVHRVARQAGVAIALFAVISGAPLPAQPQVAVAALAESEQPKLLDTLKALVNIETGSTHRDGLDSAGEFLAAKLRALNGEVEIVEAGAADIYPHKARRIALGVR